MRHRPLNANRRIRTFGWKAGNSSNYAAEFGKPAQKRRNRTLRPERQAIQWNLAIHQAPSRASTCLCPENGYRLRLAISSFTAAAIGLSSSIRSR